jgi:hypothetical protein
MRACFQEELKLRGLFYELKALREAEPQLKAMSVKASKRARSVAASRRCKLVLLAHDPGREVQGTIDDRIVGAGGKRARLLMRVRLEESVVRPPYEAECRVFLLTKGVLERFCGANALRSGDWTLSALRHLFEGESRRDPREIARVLSAVPEMSGPIGPDGAIELRFDLPAQASDFEALPDGMAIVALIGQAVSEEDR